MAYMGNSILLKAYILKEKICFVVALISMCTFRSRHIIGIIAHWQTIHWEGITIMNLYVLNIGAK